MQGKAQGIEWYWNKGPWEVLSSASSNPFKHVVEGFTEHKDLLDILILLFFPCDTHWVLQEKK
jgi:hypothetical protein